jgi:hypothetical protein
MADNGSGSAMADILLYHRPDGNADRGSSQQLLRQSRTLIAAARECVADFRGRREGRAQRCVHTREIVENSNQHLRRSAQQLFDEWARTERS